MTASKNQKSSPGAENALARSSDDSVSTQSKVKLDLAEYQDPKLATTEADLNEGNEGTWDCFKRQPGESVWHYGKRLCLEGHSVPDAFLTVAASQIGQIMLTCPNALWKAGLVSGGLFAGLTCILSLFTMYLMNVLYLDRKRKLISSGKWAKARTHATQYHDVLGFHMGKVMRYTAQTVICLQLMGTGVAQVIACAADWYSVDRSHSKRELQVIWGAALQVFILFPTFKHFRVLNVAALVGTTMTAIWIMHEARMKGYGEINFSRLWPESIGPISAPQYFFTGSAVLLNALGGHAISFEMMDVMKTPKQYTAAYTGGWLWTIFLVVPHSIAVNLAFPKNIGGADNVYGILPMSKAKVASVALMIIHQLAAFSYYVTPVVFMWERAIGTHNSAWYIRLPSRLPVSLLIWFLAMAFPFYGAINSLMSSISTPFTAFVLPCIVYMWLHRNKEGREQSVLPPLKFLQVYNWAPVFLMCTLSAIVYTGFGFTAIAYSLKTIVDNSRTFGLFARCYQCPPNYQSFLRAGAGEL